MRPPSRRDLPDFIRSRRGAWLVIASCVVSACSSGTDSGSAGGGGETASAGAVQSAGGGRSSSGGTGPSAAAGAQATGGSSGNATGGNAIGGNATGGNASGGNATGGNASGGNATGGNATGSGGSAGTLVAAGSGGTAQPPALDCGADGWAVENHGPPKNRVNYLILGDGYTATTVETTLKTHIAAALKRRFEHESGEPYGRYRNFVNICVMKVKSQSDGIGNGPTAFDGGNGGDRLAAVNEQKVNAYIKANVPASFEVDWKAVVLNQNKWENTGAYLMLWSGAGTDAPGAALHEGGHGFHQLADEYGSSTGCNNQKASCGASGTVYSEVNSAGNCSTTDGKWDPWLGTTQKGLKVPDLGATGEQGTWLGSRYVGSGQYRPSCNSMMNSLFGMNVDTSFNSVSREQMIFGIWRAVTPIDSSEPPAGAVDDPALLKLNVIDPAVINVDWTIDGVTTVNGGTSFSTGTLAPGSHVVSAKAYDNATTDLVKLRTGVCPTSVKGAYCQATAWPRSTQTVSWTVIKR